MSNERERKLSPAQATLWYRLFDSPRLQFDALTYRRETEAALGKRQVSYQRNSWRPERIDEAMTRARGDALYEGSWRERFQGEIPANWVIHDDAINDCINASKLEVDLNEEMLNAGVTHPHHLVVETFGNVQQLQEEQLTALFLRLSTVSVSILNEIKAAQVGMGVPMVTIKNAEARASSLGNAILSGAKVSLFPPKK